MTTPTTKFRFHFLASALALVFRLRVRLATWLMRGTGLELYGANDFNALREATSELYEYVEKSGYLNHRTAMQKKLREGFARLRTIQLMCEWRQPYRYDDPNTAATYFHDRLRLASKRVRMQLQYAMAVRAGRVLRQPRGDEPELLGFTEHNREVA